MSAVQPYQIFQNIPELQTGRLLMRRMVMSDVPDLFEVASDEEVTRYITWETHRSLSDTERFIQVVHDWYDRQEVLYWAVLRQSDMKLIGTCGIFEWVPKDARAELSYTLGRPYWGQGYASEVVSVMVRFAFEVMQLNRLEGRCLAENTASARVMEKAQLILDGVLRQQLYLKGAFRDLKVYSLLKQDWLNLKEVSQESPF
ncbi:MAG: acetyltransferase, ribosomal protein N-acetylase [Chloroflexi bacterium]|jgi:ribosomal-protein-alanine N-acetyltransferase|nr:acetyltransferase, ribosomal protein N-acetylase [Chloroflexota bacterium]